jgi:hypothetical protein
MSNMGYDAGIFGCELPIGFGVMAIAIVLPGGDFLDECLPSAFCKSDACRRPILAPSRFANPSPMTSAAGRRPFCIFDARSHTHRTCVHHATSVLYSRHMAAKTTTLKELGEMLVHVVQHMATKDDLSELETRLDTKIDSVESSLSGQINRIDDEADQVRRKRNRQTLATRRPSHQD